MSLRELQSVFARLAAELILHAEELGYEVTLGEAWRPPATARYYAERGIGVANSLHCDRLALDLNLFDDGVYLEETEDHEPLGLWWENRSTDEFTCIWGGRFEDGNHYSIEYQGRK